MRKFIAFGASLVVLLNSTAALALDPPSGCPSNWGLRVENGKEVTGVLALAIKTYGAGKIYTKQSAQASVADLHFGISALSLYGNQKSWVLINKAVENSEPIVFEDSLFIRMEGCPDFTLNSSRNPIKVIVTSNATNFEDALKINVNDSDAILPTRPVPLEAKDEIRLRYGSWIQLINIEANRPIASSIKLFDSIEIPSFYYTYLRANGSFKTSVFSVSRPGKNCVTTDSMVADNFGAKRGCTYDLILASYAQRDLIVSGDLILLKFSEVTYLPLAKNVTSGVNPKGNSKLTQIIKCRKGNITKQFTGTNPACPSGYKKL